MDTTFLTLGLSLIAIGILLLVVDLFIASGAVAALALVCAMVGLVFVFRYDTTMGVVIFVCLLVGLPLGVYGFLKLFPAQGIWRRGTESYADTVGAMPAVQELTDLRGRSGKALSALRPAGVVDFAGRRVDCISEGMLIEPGQWVRVIDVRASTVVVRAIERPQIEEFDRTEPLSPE